MENLKQQALFWHRQWRSRGRPHNGDITERRRITRARYHQAIRQIIKSIYVYVEFVLHKTIYDMFNVIVAL